MDSNEYWTEHQNIFKYEKNNFIYGLVQFNGNYIVSTFFNKEIKIISSNLQNTLNTIQIDDTIGDLLIVENNLLVGTNNNGVYFYNLLDNYKFIKKKILNQEFNINIRKLWIHKEFIIIGVLNMILFYKYDTFEFVKKIEQVGVVNQIFIYNNYLISSSELNYVLYIYDLNNDILLKRMIHSCIIYFIFNINNYLVIWDNNRIFHFFNLENNLKLCYVSPNEFNFCFRMWINIDILVCGDYYGNLKKYKIDILKNKKQIINTYSLEKKIEEIENKLGLKIDLLEKNLEKNENELQSLKIKNNNLLNKLENENNLNKEKILILEDKYIKIIKNITNDKNILNNKLYKLERENYDLIDKNNFLEDKIKSFDIKINNILNKFEDLYKKVYENKSINPSYDKELFSINEKIYAINIENLNKQKILENNFYNKINFIKINLDNEINNNKESIDNILNNKNLDKNDISIFNNKITKLNKGLKGVLKYNKDQIKLIKENILENNKIIKNEIIKEIKKSDRKDSSNNSILNDILLEISNNENIEFSGI